MSNLIYEQEKYSIRKAIFEVYQEMGCGYLKATGNKLALLVNFGHYPKVEIERFIL